MRQSSDHVVDDIRWIWTNALLELEISAVLLTYHTKFASMTNTLGFKRRNKVSIFIVLAFLVIWVLTSSAIVQATTVLHSEAEGSGDIINEVENTKNLNGAMVWNGTGWVVNPTWEHQYFVDTRTGNRLKSYTSLDATVSGLPPGETEVHQDGYGKYYPNQNFGNYSITKQTYWYTKSVTIGNGNYQYGAVEYRITDAATGLQVILRSRGVGEDISNAYFDIYIEDYLTSGSSQTTAFIGDPEWYTFPVKAVAALGINDLSQYRTGSLPGAITRQSNNYGDYYFDLANGADMGPAGVGKSFELHTTPLVSKFSDLSPSYITGFELKFMDSSGNLQKIVVYPTLFSEKYNPSTASTSPTQTISPSPTVPEFPSITILITLAIGAVITTIAYKKSKK
jgi:hypothetical protein